MATSIATTPTHPDIIMLVGGAPSIQLERGCRRMAIGPPDVGPVRSGDRPGGSVTSLSDSKGRHPTSAERGVLWPGAHTPTALIMDVSSPEPEEKAIPAAIILAPCSGEARMRSWRRPAEVEAKRSAYQPCTAYQMSAGPWKQLITQWSKRTRQMLTEHFFSITIRCKTARQTSALDLMPP